MSDEATAKAPSTCQAITKRTGLPCGRPAVEGGYCGHHRPSTRATKARNARLRGVAALAIPQPLADNPPADREETYEAVITEAWSAYDSGKGMDPARHRALKLALDAMAARDQDARDRIRLKVGEAVMDRISFDAPEAPTPPCATPWEAHAGQGASAPAAPHPIH
jgi:hypothetical protein